MTTNYDEDQLAKTYMPIILKRYRNAAGISQRELARRAGICKSYISSLESGLRAPNLNVLVKIADSIGVRPGVLVDAMVDEAFKEIKSQK